MKKLSLIGHGGIGSALATGIVDLPDWLLGKVLTRHRPSSQPASTTDPTTFLSHPADLIIEAAGPGALREHGVAALAHAPIWTVGAAALADPAFRAEIEATSARSGHKLRLFACGLAGMPLEAERLSLTMRRPGLGAGWSGPLAEAVALFPNELNTAVAAALAGPGIEATQVRLEDSGAGGAHEILLEAECPVAAWRQSVTFAPAGEGTIHPVAAMILTALAREQGPLVYS